MKQRTLYVATGNRGKLRDFAAAARAVDLSWLIEPLPDLEQVAAPAEDGTTFLANAQSKALYYSQFAPGVMVVADDSGLVVDALGGAPGVYSARYAQLLEGSAMPNMQGSNDERNNARLLRELARSAAAPPWTARYRCVLAVACDGKLLADAEGSVEGEMVKEARGENGFGYDPYFLLPKLGRTMAELDMELRLQLNHRGAALRALLPRLDAST